MNPLALVGNVSTEVKSQQSAHHTAGIEPPQAESTTTPVAEQVCRLTGASCPNGLESWLWAGGAHHIGYSTQIGSEHLQVYADLLGIEFVRIGKGTTLEHVRTQLAVQHLLARSSSA